MATKLRNAWYGNSQLNKWSRLCTLYKCAKSKTLILSQWFTADDFLEQHFSGKRFLLPPQIYEMNRIRNIQDIDTMKELAHLRLQLGLERWCPFLINAQDGMLAILPGLYLII